MKKQMLIVMLTLSMLAGFGATAGIARLDTGNEAAGEKVAFWSLLYERPNPERLPVKVTFRFL